MALKLKPLDEQVIVITGASSGIGLETAHMAARKGARLVLAARSEDTLQDIAKEINSDGGQAVAVRCDVADFDQVQHVACVAIERFGRIDTWINNAGLGMYGRLEQTVLADSRRLFDINYWGVVHGSLVALPHLRKNGGALINLGSEVSDAVSPLLGMYSASKHAVKGFTDGLRLEVQTIDQAPVSITLIQPTAVDTPFPQHAKNYMEEEPKLPTPIIEPSQVAEAILAAAVKPTRDHKVGTMSKINTLVAKIAPGIGDKMAAKQLENLHYDEAAKGPDGALNAPSESTRAVGQTHGAGP